MKKPSMITIDDYSQYVQGKSSNGGCYIYSTFYKYVSKLNVYEITYSTSAEFPYCVVYGCFCNETDEENSCCRQAKPKMVTYEEVMEKIKDMEKYHKNNFDKVIKITIKE